MIPKKSPYINSSKLIDTDFKHIISALNLNVHMIYTCIASNLIGMF